jgi:hypothetical protein
MHLVSFYVLIGAITQKDILSEYCCLLGLISLKIDTRNSSETFSGAGVVCAGPLDVLI